MPSYTRKILFSCLALLISHTSFSKESFSFRKLLNRLQVSASVGYGTIDYTHQALHTRQAGPKGAVILFKEGDKFYLYSGEPGIVYLVQWFDGPYIRMKSYTDLSRSDIPKATTSVKFNGKGSMLPFFLSAYTDLWSKMRVGLGGAFSINSIESLAPVDEDHKSLGEYTPLQKEHYHLRPFGILGYKFIDNSIFSLLLDTNIGFDFTYSFAHGKFIDVFNLGVQNIGLSFEGNISEYFRLLGRVSYERSNLIKLLDGKKVGVVIEREGLVFQFGFSLNYPEIPRCPLSECGIERKHIHGGKLYRGTSIFTNRDAQGRRMYKK